MKIYNDFIPVRTISFDGWEGWQVYQWIRTELTGDIYEMIESDKIYNSEENCRKRCIELLKADNKKSRDFWLWIWKKRLLWPVWRIKICFNRIGQKRKIPTYHVIKGKLKRKRTWTF